MFFDLNGLRRVKVGAFEKIFELLQDFRAIHEYLTVLFGAIRMPEFLLQERGGSVVLN